MKDTLLCVFIELVYNFGMIILKEREMPDLAMNGPCQLDPDTINYLIENKIGNYALGYIENDDFIVTYVGRGNVYDRLYKHLTDEYNQPCFYFSYARGEAEACIKECKNFHDFGGTDRLDNKEHPKLPKGKKCSYCNHVDE